MTRAPAFKELEQSLDQALRQIGGRVTPLGDERTTRGCGRKHLILRWLASRIMTR